MDRWIDNIYFWDGVTSCDPCDDVPATYYDSNLTTSASPVDWADDDWSVSAWTKQSEAGMPVSADGWKFGQQTGLFFFRQWWNPTSARHTLPLRKFTHSVISNPTATETNDRKNHIFLYS